MAYKFQRGTAILSGALDQEGAVTVKDPATGVVKGEFRDTGVISGSSDLLMGGTVRFDGVATAAVDVAGDFILYVDDTDKLVKKEAVGDFASDLAGTGLEQNANTIRIAAAAAGNGLSGGGGSALALDLNELSAAAVNVANDSIAIVDADDNTSKKESIADLATAMAGNAIAASNGSFSVGVDDSSIEIDSDALRVKAAGITDSMLNDDVATGLAGDGLVASSGVLAVQTSGAVRITSDKVAISGSMAGIGLSFDGGVNSIASLDLDLNELSAGAIASGDSLAFVDANDSNVTKKESVDDLATLFAGVGLSAASAVLALDFSELTDEAIASGDRIAFRDAGDDGMHAETVDDLATLFAGVGLSAASAVMALDLNELGAAAVDVSADSIAIVDANDSNASKKESIADLITAIAGAGLTATNGVLSTDGGAVDDLESGDTLSEGYNYATGSSTAVVNLPGAPSVGDSVTIKAADLGANHFIRVNRQGSHTIDGETSITLESPFASVTCVYLAANNWGIV